MVFPVDKRTKEQKGDQQRANLKKGRAKIAKYRENPPYPKSEPMIVETDLADMYADIYNPSALIAPELKIQAAMCFVLTGTVSGAAKLSGLEPELISRWKNHSQWWGTVLAKCKKEKQDELDAQLTDVIHGSVVALKDRLENGDEVVTKDGIVKKQVGARDLATVLNTLFDKRSMIRGDPTSITRKESSEDILKTLRGEFEKIAEDAMGKTVVGEQ
jgi:hypothetical protein